uniref:RING-type domain-containing protein n=1 Tax=Anabas testudineus TaxID=64144 RepID=A0A3Q1I076_ANATE
IERVDDVFRGSALLEDLCCPVCYEVFRDPVLLSCSHTFCKDCLNSWWREKVTQECPTCKRRSSRSEPPLNRVLKNLCESLILHRDQRETASLFRLIQDHRGNLQRSLKTLQDKLEQCQKVKVQFDQTAEHIKVQARHTERQIKEQFKKLHQFLEEEEEGRMAALREEDEHKSQRMKEKMETLSREIAALSYTVRATEEELRAGDVSFLNNYKAAVERFVYICSSELMATASLFKLTYCLILNCTLTCLKALRTRADVNPHALPFVWRSIENTQSLFGAIIY